MAQANLSFMRPSQVMLRSLLPILVLSCIPLVLLVAFLLLNDVGEVRSQVTCTTPLVLEPRTLPGPIWVQHRHVLELPSALTLPWYEDRPGHWLPGYLIQNQRTGRLYHWDAAVNRGGRKRRFAVPTRYAELLNRSWERDPWRLCLLDLPVSRATAP